jgi:hypothetical protein
MFVFALSVVSPYQGVALDRAGITVFRDMGILVSVVMPPRGTQKP